MWELVKKQMIKAGLNQEQLAKIMKVHSGTISDLKNGHIKKTSFELMKKIADALDISLDEFR